MKFIIIVLISASVSADVRQSRRQAFGYNNNVIHQNPAFPDQTGQSAVQVTFNPKDLHQQKSHYSPYIQQSYQPQHQIQTYNPNQSQLFNVGYSVKFTNSNQQHQQPQLAQQQPRNIDGDIITGTRKVNEQVQRPSQNQEYISALDNKKHKISGIKPRPTIMQNYPNPKTVLSQANLAPQTQQYLKYLEQTKQAQNPQQLQQQYSWRNLSPGVEIIRSTEVPAKYHKSPSPNFIQAQAQTNQPQAQHVQPEQPEPQHFDHAKALTRSQDFDYSNAIEGQELAQLFQQNPESLPPITRALPQTNQNQAASQPVIVAQPQKGLNTVASIDTSLLRQPAAIEVDTRLLEEAMQNYNKQVQVQPVQHYRTLPEMEYQSSPSRNQFKYYAKPQPLSSIHPEQSRHPRFIPDLQTSLRPPPYNPRFQRRIHLGY